MTFRCSKQSNYYAIWIFGTIICILFFFFAIQPLLLTILSLNLATGISPFWDKNQWLFWVVIVLIAIAASCFIFIVPYLAAVKLSNKPCNAVLQNNSLLLAFGKKQTTIPYKSIKSITFTSVRFTKGVEASAVYNVYIKVKNKSFYIQSPSLSWAKKLAQQAGVKFDSKIN